MAHLVRPWIVGYRDPKTHKRVPKGTPGAKRVRRRASKYYAAGVSGWPKSKRVPLASDKIAAGQMLADIVKQAERGQAGVADRFQEHRTKPIAEHLAAWRRQLEGRGNTAEYVELAVGRVRDLADGCGFRFVGDIEADPIARWLAELRRDKPPAALPAGLDRVSPGEIAARLGVTLAAVWQQARRLGLSADGKGRARRYPRAAAEQLLARAGRGASVQTANYYLASLKSFCRWMVRDRRIPQSPVEHLQGGNPKMDRRHDRRELAVAELLRILDAAQASPAVFRGLGGVDRFHLYLAACGTGYRAEELAALVPESFSLAADPPTATLPAAATKNRKGAVQPLPPGVAGALREYLVDRPAGLPVWPGRWYDDAAEMLRIDLAAADVPYEVAGPDGPLFADFHALRHTYVSQLARSGATVKQAQTLARHSQAELTIGRYSHTALPELGSAVDRLPMLTNGRPESTVEVVAVPAEDLAVLVALAARGIALEAMLAGPGHQVQPGVQNGDGRNGKA